MKIVSTNVNGIRAAYKKGLFDFLKSEDADIYMLQEIKAEKEQLEFDLPSDYFIYWNSAQRKGYSGTAVFSRTKPIECTFGLGDFDNNEEGRVITLEYEDFYLVCVYTPNSKDGLGRLGYRQAWDDAFRAHLQALDKLKPVVAAGDFNVAHNEIDLKNPDTNHMSAGFTDEERSKFSALLEAGFADTFRYLYPDKVEYSWFSYRTKARSRNAGWRIDYFLASSRLLDRVKDSLIVSSVDYSDHIPVEIILDIG